MEHMFAKRVEKIANNNPNQLSYLCTMQTPLTHSKQISRVSKEISLVRMKEFE